MLKLRARLILIQLVLVFFTVISSFSAHAGGLEPGTPEYETSLLRDLEYRLSLPQSDMPKSQWYTPKELSSLWGPMPRKYPGIEKMLDELPLGTDLVQWKRDRVIAIAKHYIGLPYRHHHIPAWEPREANRINQPGPGLDCSNFTAWVYNFGFGISLNGDVEKQAARQPRPGYSLPEDIRSVSAKGPFYPGDLLYILDVGHRDVVHTVIFIDDEHIIDSTDGQVAVRHFSGWYRTRLSHALRIFN